MLNGIARCLSPDLLAHLMRMGHGDEIAIVDLDFPAYTCGVPVIRADGIAMLAMLKGILPLFPLDTYVSCPVAMMSAVDPQPTPVVWKSFAAKITEYYPSFNGFDYLERYAFYQRAKNCYGIVVTGEIDGNIILRKGVVAF